MNNDIIMSLFEELVVVVDFMSNVSIINYLYHYHYLIKSLAFILLMISSSKNKKYSYIVIVTNSRVIIGEINKACCYCIYHMTILQLIQK